MRPMFDTPQRPRRRLLRMLVLLVVGFGVITALLVAAAGDETRQELEYLGEVRSQALQLARSGESVVDLTTRLREIDRDEFTTTFETALGDVAEALLFTEEEPPVESLIPFWSLYRLTLETWDSGLRTFSESLLLAADDPEDEFAETLVAEGLAQLRAGDALYEDVQTFVDRVEVPDPLAPLADVRMSAESGTISSLATSYTVAARATTNTLGLRPELQLSQVLSDPPWQVNANGEVVTVSTESITISAVVTNSGNVASPLESLLLTFIGGAEPLTAQVEVPALDPEGQTTLTFDPIAVTPGTTYTASVELVISSPDSDLTDNAEVVEFLVAPS